MAEQKNCFIAFFYLENIDVDCVSIKISSFIFEINQMCIYITNNGTNFHKKMYGRYINGLIVFFDLENMGVYSIFIKISAFLFEI